MIDALRHAGRAQLSSFAGGANAAMDESIWADTPYREADLQAAVRPRRRASTGSRACRSSTDVNNYVAGVNKFITEACAEPEKLPGEYNLIDPSQSICLPGHEWKVADVIAIASLVAGIFGKGGGGELGARAVARRRPSSGSARRTGRKVWARLPGVQRPRGADDRPREELPLRPAAGAARRGVALPDPRHAPARERASQSASGSAPAANSAPAAGELPRDPEARSSSTTAPPTRCSSRARESKSGHPVGGDRAPGRLLVAADPDGGGHPRPGDAARGRRSTRAARPSRAPTSTSSSATGATTPGAPPRPARTSSTPTRSSSAIRAAASRRSTPTTTSSAGKCLPFDVLTRTNSWVPTAADQTPAGSETLTALRTKLGIVDRAGEDPRQALRLHAAPRHLLPRGRPVGARASPTSTTPARCARPQDFMQAANDISYTFNWFYVDNKHIAYFNSGANPVRPEQRRPEPPDVRPEALPLEELQRRTPRPRTMHAAGRASARDRPALPDELEQPAGAGLQHRLLVAVPLAAARRADPARHRGLEEDHPAAADQRHGGRRAPSTCAATGCCPGS